MKLTTDLPNSRLNPVDLVKDRVVGGVDLVAAVAVADDEEVVEAAGWQFNRLFALLRHRQLFKCIFGRLSEVSVSSNGKKVCPFCCCCTADSQTDAGLHELYNNTPMVFFPLLNQYRHLNSSYTCPNHE